MEAPEPVFNVYDLIPQGAPRRGSQGAALAWDTVVYLHTQLMPQFWRDMDNISGGGLIV